MNKLALKVWLESKMDTLTFRKTISKEDTPEIDAQLKILKEMYDDFNLEDVGIEFLMGI